MYSVKAPVGEEYRLCLKELEIAKTCEERERALRSAHVQINYNWCRRCLVW